MPSAGSGPDLDSTAWYQVVVAAFPGNSFYGDWFANGTNETAVFLQVTDLNNTGQQWQFTPVFSSSSSSYFVRCRQAGSDFYLAASGSVPVMLAGPAAAGDWSVVWNISAWGDGDYYYFTNMANGTGYHLGSKNNAQMLIDPDTTEGDNQQFSFTNVGSVQDPSFLFAQVQGLNTSGSTATPSSASGAGTPAGAGGTASPPPSGLTVGAAAGIGVGVTLGVVLVVLAVLWTLFRRRQKGSELGWQTRIQQADQAAAAKLVMQPPIHYQQAVPPHELSGKHFVGELPVHTASQEMPA